MASIFFLTISNTISCTLLKLQMTFTMASVNSILTDHLSYSAPAGMFSRWWMDPASAVYSDRPLMGAGKEVSHASLERLKPTGLV